MQLKLSLQLSIQIKSHHHILYIGTGTYYITKCKRNLQSNADSENRIKLDLFYVLHLNRI
jgi:hypothetical protein